MRSDIRQLMKDRNLDAVVVHGSTGTSSDLAYVTGGATLERALYIQRADGDPVIFTSVLEREVAASTGHRIRMWSEYDILGYLERSGRDRVKATVSQWSDILRDENVHGRVGFHGYGDIGAFHTLLSALERANPHIEVVGELGPGLFVAARETKDAAELNAMRKVGSLTCEVVTAVVDFLSSHRAANGHLVKSDGQPLRIGDVKSFIRVELVRRNLDEPQETIFSQGRDAGVPHNSGDAAAPLRLGEPIVFDIFPRHRESGYFHDVTRTFFLGHVPDHLGQAWTEVKTAFDRAMSELAVGEPCARYQALVCDIFEAAGHPTIRSDPRSESGYVHSLGHGVGLDVHEAPTLSAGAAPDAVLRPGHVVTVEPGLYYPEQGWGIRIEDTVAFDADGRLVDLTELPYEPLIDVR